MWPKLAGQPDKAGPRPASCDHPGDETQQKLSHNEALERKRGKGYPARRATIKTTSE